VAAVSGPATVAGMRNPMLFVVVAALIAATPSACNKSDSVETSSADAITLKTLSVDEVAAKLKEPNTFVFDNNNPDRYKKGHVPGATWIRPDEITAAVLPKDKTATLVFYCANEQCRACHSGAKAALALGYKNVYIMPAGIAGWEKSGKPMDVVS
jgi:rhodanese-related sulfurtransferase